MKRNEDDNNLADGLRQKIKKRRPFDSPQQAAALQLLRTSDQLGILLTRLFREYGLTSAQYNILRILRGEGAPLPILEIASRTITVVPGITGLINRLEALHLVRRERCKEDRRVVYIEITPQALGILKQLDEPLEDLHQRAFKGLSATQIKDLIGLLEKVP